MAIRKEEIVDDIDTHVRARKTYGKNYSGAVFLIFLGIIFLLNNLGILPWQIWNEIWKFWPVILILIGFELFLGKSPFARFVMGVITLLIFALILLYVLSVYGYYIPRF